PPGDWGLGAGRAVATLRAVVDDDGGLVFAAILAVGVLVGALGHRIAVVAVVGVLPARVLAVRGALERRVLGLARPLLVRLVHVGADLVADEAADEDAGCRGRQLPAAMTELRTDQDP